MRKLYYTYGSPFARAVRIVLAEKGLAFEREATPTTPSAQERAKSTPTLQVPALIDGDQHLWDSTVILEYLMASYPNAVGDPGQQPFANTYVRTDYQWQDRLTLATLQTLGVSTAIISQLRWSGLRHSENSFATRSAERIQYLLDWFEQQIVSDTEGFVPGVASVQDVLLAAWCQFIERRPIDLTWQAPGRPKTAALIQRLAARASFAQEPVLWWEPGVTYVKLEEEQWARTKTIYS
jgi:glutathione S-transferase